MDMDNSNDAADPDTMIRHADQMMKGVTGTATLSLARSPHHHRITPHHRGRVDWLAEV